MTSIAQNKHELVLSIQSAFSKLEKDYAGVPEQLARHCDIEGNVKKTVISICDTLAYLIGWGKLVLKWYDGTSNNRPVDFPETGFNWNQLGKLAQHFQHQHSKTSLPELMTEWREVTSDILALVEQLTDKQLYEKPWYDKWTLGRMIQFNTSSPMKNVRTKVRRFKRAHNLK